MTDRGPPRDHRQEVTDRIITLLEQGTAPWQRPWATDSSLRIPINPTTGKPYRGGNVLNLMIEGLERGYTDSRWCTYRQAAEKGWQVRKGEKGSRIEFWDVRQPGDQDEESDEGRKRLIHRVYTVFNGQQIDGIPEIPLPKREAWEAEEAGERILNGSGATIRMGGNRAYFNRTTDHIQMPNREAFPDAASWYGTALHELTHWTGAETRLKRENLLLSRGFNTQDEHYAREEIVAELGSLMIAAETGIPNDPLRHAAYIDSWIAALKKDKNEIFRAASQASAAVDYVLGLDRAQAADVPASHALRISEASHQNSRSR